jgi:hypothetical protein
MNLPFTLVRRGMCSCFRKNIRFTLILIFLLAILQRINPGDKEHTVDKILKVTSGSTPEVD